MTTDKALIGLRIATIYNGVAESNQTINNNRQTKRPDLWPDLSLWPLL